MNDQTENNKIPSARFSRLIKKLRPLLIILGVIGLCSITALVYYRISSYTFDPLRSIFGSYRNYLEIEGTVTGEIYTPPLKNFRCRFPSLQTGPKGKVLQDQFWTDGSGVVVFGDNFGTLLRVDYWEVNETTIRLLEDPETKKLEFEEQLSRLMQETFLPSRPNTIISRKEFLENENGAMLFAVIDSGKSSDMLKGALYLSKSKFVYRLMNNSGSIENLKQGLLDFYHTCEFK